MDVQQTNNQEPQKLDGSLTTPLAEADLVSILIVDDNPGKLASLAAIVGGMHLQVVTASSGRDALRQLLKQNFAVVLLDVNMPVMDGFETATLIHNRPSSAYTPIIFVIAEAGSDIERFKGYTMGAVDYIYSPIVPEVLKAKVAVFVDLFYLNRQLQRQSEQLLQQAEVLAERTQQLETTNKELESFSYSISHDLRSPLRAIDGYAQVLQEDHSAKMDAEAKRLFTVIRTNAQKMGQMIEDLLAFSRLGRQAICAGEVDMEALAQEVFDELNVNACNANVRFTVKPMPYAKGDRSLLRHVWSNLISNGVKFTSRKTQPAIETGADMIDSEAIYYVKDNGAGFNMAEYDKLFGVFQRLHTKDDFPGNGVGLAIVQRIVFRHGGRVWADSQVGRGTTFYFSLPTAAYSVNSSNGSAP